MPSDPHPNPLPLGEGGRVQSPSYQVRRHLWPRWVFANTVGLGVGLALLRATIPSFNGDEFRAGLSWATLALIAVTALSVAVVLGLAQGWAVRPLALPDRSGFGKWSGLTMLGVLLGWPLALLIAIPLGLGIGALYPNQPPLAQTVIRYSIAALIGAIVGAVQATCQARLLRHGMHNAKQEPADPHLSLPIKLGAGSLPEGEGTRRNAGQRWIGASVLGGGIGFVVMLALLPVADGVTAQGTLPIRLLAAFAVGCVSGAAGSVVTGRTLALIA